MAVDDGEVEDDGEGVNGEGGCYVSDGEGEEYVETSSFPYPNLVDVASGADLNEFGLYGGIFTFATFYLSLVIFLYGIVCEKARGLRDALRLAGQTQSQHW